MGATGLSRIGDRPWAVSGGGDSAGERRQAGEEEPEAGGRRFPGPAGSGREEARVLLAALPTSSGSAWRRAPGAESRCRQCRQLAGLPETPSA